MKTVPQFLLQRFADLTRDMLHEFEVVKRDRAANPVDEGGRLERTLRKFLLRFLPEKFAVTSGYVMNQSGSISSQQDLIIYDRLNATLLERAEAYDILAIEDVYATIEVKSRLNKATMEDAAQNIRSVKQLHYTDLLVHLSDGEIAEVSGPDVFSTLFAFDVDTTLETAADNIDKSYDMIDYTCIIAKGNICWALQRPHGKDHAIIKTLPHAKPDCMKAILTPKQSPGEGVLTLIFIYDLLEHLEKQYQSRLRPQHPQLKNSVLSYMGSTAGLCAFALAKRFSRPESPPEVEIT